MIQRTIIGPRLLPRLQLPPLAPLVALAILSIGVTSISCAPHKPTTDAASAQANQQVAGSDMYVLGAQAYRSGEKEKAFKYLLDAVSQNPNLRMAQAMLADLYRQKGDYRNAAAHYDAAARLDPYSIANHYNLGVMYQLLRRFQDAAAAYLRALDLNPRDVKSNMNLGTVYLSLGQTNDAVNYLERATMIDGNSSDAWSNLGVAYDSVGKTQLAEQAYRKALELKGASPAVMQNLGANLITQNRTAEAVAVMEQVIQKSDTPSAHKVYGDALAQAKRYDEAIEQYNQALKLDKSYYPAMNGKGYALLAQYKSGMELDEDKLRDAAALWKVSLRLNPQQPKVAQALKEVETPSGTFGKRG